jgi:hypothetical protein
MLWLGFIEINKIMMNLIYFLGPHFFVASLESVTEQHP